MKDNKLIAEFMGMTYGDPNDNSVMTQTTPQGNEMVPIESMDYHKSWDWLMPVIKKIEAKNYWFNRLDGDVSIMNDKGIVVSTPMSDGGIDMYYQTVVVFIKMTNLIQTHYESK